MGKTGQNPFVFADFAQRCFRCAAPCRRAVGLGADCDAARAQKSEDVSLIILQKLGLLQNELAIEVYTKGTGTTGRKPPRKLRWLPWRGDFCANCYCNFILQRALFVSASSIPPPWYMVRCRFGRWICHNFKIMHSRRLPLPGV